MTTDPETGVQYKRQRTGPLYTGYFNKIGLPGVKTFLNGSDIDSAWNREQIKFDGDASQLFYPPDMFDIEDRVVYIRAKRDDGTYARRRVGFLNQDLASQGAVSVSSYGAKGDGSTDDTAAFNEALAAHNLVYVPPGTYSIASKITITNDGTRLFGAACGSSVLRAAEDMDGETVMMGWNSSEKGGGPNDVVIHDLGFEGEDRAGFIYVDGPTGGSKNMRVERCKFRNFIGDFHAVHTKGVDGVTVQDCVFKRGGSELYFHSFYARRCDDVRVHGCWFEGCGGQSVKFTDGTRMNVTGNTILGTRSANGRAVNCSDCRQVVIASNTFKGAFQKTVIRSGSEGGGGFKQVIIANNAIQCNTSGTYIICNNGSEATVTGNRIWGGDEETAAGIRFRRCNDCLCSDNQLRHRIDPGTRTFSFIKVEDEEGSGRCTRVFVFDNVFRTSGPAGTFVAVDGRSPGGVNRNNHGGSGNNYNPGDAETPYIDLPVVTGSSDFRGTVAIGDPDGGGPRYSDLVQTIADLDGNALRTLPQVIPVGASGGIPEGYVHASFPMETRDFFGGSYTSPSPIGFGSDSRAVMRFLVKLDGGGLRTNHGFNFENSDGESLVSIRGTDGHVFLTSGIRTNGDTDMRTDAVHIGDPGGSNRHTNLPATITNLINNKTNETRTISTGDGLTGGGDLAADRTLAVDGTVARTSDLNDKADKVFTYSKIDVDRFLSRMRFPIQITVKGYGLADGGLTVTKNPFAQDIAVDETSNTGGMIITLKDGTDLVPFDYVLSPESERNGYSFVFDNTNKNKLTFDNSGTADFVFVFDLFPGNTTQTAFGLLDYSLTYPVA